MTKPQSLARILITNDDGIDAPGLAALIHIAKEFAPEIWIVAPQHDESGTGQSLSLHHPLRCEQRGERRFAVSGTPADCVAIARGHLMKEAPSVILSGVNAGRNTGDDVNLSGTLGAAFMGLMLGIPSLAMSLECTSRATAKWETARALGPSLLRHFLQHGWADGTCLSINLPDLPPEKVGGFSWARQAARTISAMVIEERADLRDKPYYWMTTRDREPPSDSRFDEAILARGDVAVTALTLDRSVQMDQPRMVFDGKQLVTFSD